MTNQTQKDEDLIIISDDSSTDTSILDFNFNVNETSTNTTTEPVITFWDETSNAIADTSLDLNFGTEIAAETSEVSNDLVLSDTTNDISTTEDLFNLWSVEETNTENVVQTQDETQTSDEINFGFWEDISVAEATVNDEITTNNELVNNITSFQESNWFEYDDYKKEDFDDLEWQAELSVTSQVGSLNEQLGDRNEILDWTIKKLKQRKEIVSQIKQSRQTNIDDLNEQIAKLKKEVSDLQSEIKDLEKEETSIELDIVSIEKMKANVLEISTDRPRKHNLDNIKKSK